MVSRPGGTPGAPGVSYVTCQVLEPKVTMVLTGTTTLVPLGFRIFNSPRNWVFSAGAELRSRSASSCPPLMGSTPGGSAGRGSIGGAAETRSAPTTGPASNRNKRKLWSQNVIRAAAPGELNRKCGGRIAP